MTLKEINSSSNFENNTNKNKPTRKNSGSDRCCLQIRWREDLLHQAYRIVEDAGPEGVTQSDMAKKLGQTKLDSRTICRNLQRCNTVHSLMKDVGRQRVSRYVSHKFMQTGHLTQEFR